MDSGNEKFHCIMEDFQRQTSVDILSFLGLFYKKDESNSEYKFIRYNQYLLIRKKGRKTALLTINEIKKI